MSENKRPVGRPTDYKPEYCQMLIDYFSIEPYKEIQKKIYTKSGALIEIPEDRPADFPSLAGFCIKIGIHRDTLHEWTKNHPEFSDVYRLAKEYQENYLLVNGNKELIPTNFATFLLINHSNYRQKAKDEAPDTTITQNFSGKSQEELRAIVKDGLSKLSPEELKKIMGEKE